jgi:type II secretory pathway pseudopilin PulG
MPGSGKIKQIDRSQVGDTLIEVVVAMLVLGIIILDLVPLYSQVRVHEIMDTTRVAAYNLAESQIEAIKSAHFGTAVAWAASTAYNVGDEVRPNVPNGHIYRCTQEGTSGASEPDWPIGDTVTDGSVTWQEAGGSGMGTYTAVSGNIVYGDPPGQFPQQSSISDPQNPGIVYNMSTQIRWKPDPSKSTTDSTQINYNDYKDITVEVKAQNQDGTRTYQDVTLNTMVAAENEWGGLPGGNIRVIAVNGTVSSDDPNYYVGNMKVDLTGPSGDNHTTYEMLTDNASGDMPGVFFTLLPTPYPSNTYLMTAYDNPNYDNNNDVMMVLPSQSSQSVQLTPYQTAPPLTFQVAPASTLILNFTGSTFNGTVELECDDAGIDYKLPPGTTYFNPLTGTTSSNSSGTTSLNIINLWPAGSGWVNDTFGDNNYYTLTVTLSPGSNYTNVSYPSEITLTPGKTTTINVTLSKT